LAKRLGARRLAFGYTNYQSAWLEQSIPAVERLRRFLATRGVELLLPVYDLSSKSQAISELEALGLSGEALEQKCLVQQRNLRLSPETREHELDEWETSLGELDPATAALSLSDRVVLKDLP